MTPLCKKLANPRRKPADKFGTSIGPTRQTLSNPSSGALTSLDSCCKASRIASPLHRFLMLEMTMSGKERITTIYFQLSKKSNRMSLLGLRQCLELSRKRLCVRCQSMLSALSSSHCLILRDCTKQSLKTYTIGPMAKYLSLLVVPSLQSSTKGKNMRFVSWIC